MTRVSPSGQREIIRNLCSAVQHGRIDDVDRLLNEHDEFINADEGGNMIAKSLYRNLLMISIDVLEPDIAKLLVVKGININHKYWSVNGKQSARDLAVENGMCDVARMIDNKLPAPMNLFLAVVDGSVTRTHQLIGHIDTDINMKVNSYGDKTPGSSAFTLLMIAIKHNHEDVAELLINNQIDLTFEHQEWERPNPETEELLVVSYTALELASQTNMYDVVKLIKSKRSTPKNDKVVEKGVKSNIKSDDVKKMRESQSMTQGPRNTQTGENTLPSIEQDCQRIETDNAIADDKHNKRRSDCCIVV